MASLHILGNAACILGGNLRLARPALGDVQNNLLDDAGVCRNGEPVLMRGNPLGIWKPVAALACHGNVS